MNPDLSLAHRRIGRQHPPFLIAEMSGNHNQSLDRALVIVDAAAQAGAHGLKIQTYTADTMTPDLVEGEPPKYYDVLLGKRVNREIKRGTAVEWEYIG